MSFILDALRKSEHDRQRDKGPALAEVAVARPVSKKNVWAAVAMALLLVNLVAIGVFLLQRSGSDDTTNERDDVAAGTSAAADDAARGAGAPLPADVGETSIVASVRSGRAADTMREMPGTLPPVLQPALPASDGTVSHNPLADELSDDGIAEVASDAQGYDATTGYPTAPPGMSGPPTKRGSVVYAPLPEADPVTSPSRAQAGAMAAGPGTSATEPRQVSSLPTADEIGAQAGLPELNLELHVYSNKSGERFVFVNSARYKEGDTLKEGPRVDHITAEGVELSYRGNRFTLPRP